MTVTITDAQYTPGSDQPTMFTVVVSIEAVVLWSGTVAAYSAASARRIAVARTIGA